MLESDATQDQIERTSSRTLLELMAVSGLACSSVMYWSESTYAGLLLYFVQASILGIASVLVSMTCYYKIREWGPKHILLLIAMWLATWFLISANSILILRHKPYGFPTWTALLNTSILYSVVACACCASLLLMIHILIVGTWLRLCGWRIEQGVPSNHCKYESIRID